MSGLPAGYDSWRTRADDNDDYCEVCGAYLAGREGWGPDECTGECQRGWRDPDYEYEMKRDREIFGDE